MEKDSVPEFDIHPGTARAQTLLDAIERRTGRTIDDWIATARDAGPESGERCRKWLETTHGLGPTEAWWIAARSSGEIEDGTVIAYSQRKAPLYIEAMLAGKNAGLRPIYERLLSLARALGNDVRVCPTWGVVSLFRLHLFAQIDPCHSDVRLSLALGETRQTRRSTAIRGFSRSHGLTHLLRLRTLDGIDAEVEEYLAIAYKRGNLPLSPPRGQRTIT